MRRNILLVGSLLALLILGLVGCGYSGVAEGQQPSSVDVNLNNQSEGIWVTGQGTVTVTPDIVNLSLGVSAQADTVAQAQSQAATAMDSIMQSLRDNGVADKDIRTQQFSIYQVTRWDKDTQQEIVTGYRVSNMVTVKIRTIDKAGAIIDAVAEAGGDLTRINGISFSVDDPTKYHEEARQKAMDDAKAKAGQIADLADVTLGKPTYISENFYSPMPMPVPMDARSEGMSVPTTPISPGETDIVLSVQVIYAIQ